MITSQDWWFAQNPATQTPLWEGPMILRDDGFEKLMVHMK